MTRFVWPGEPPTETESLRQQLKAAQDELRRRDVQMLLDQQAEHQVAKQLEDQMATAKRVKAQAAALEAKRRSAWLQHHTDLAVASRPKSFASFLSTKNLEEACLGEGWPPGHDPPNEEHVEGITEPVDVADIGSTRLGQFLKGPTP